MLNWIIDFSLRHRLLVILAIAGAAPPSAWSSLRQLDIDAFPDTTPVQVQINTVAPALGPEEVERQITFPIEQAISGLPRLEQLRSISKFGLSQVVVDVRRRHRHLLRPPADQRAAGDGRDARRASTGRRWGRSPPGWAKSSTTSSPARATT